MSETNMVVENVALVDIHADDEFNCRGKISPVDVVDLAQDIERQGLIQPVVASPYKETDRIKYGKKYRLIAGYRRYTAHVVLKRNTIPTIIRSDMINDTDARFFNLAENMQRKNLDVLQEARALEKLKNLDVSETEVASRLGKSRGWVQIRYMLLNLPKEIQNEVALGNITQTQIRELYMVFHNAGAEATFKAARDIKDAKARGRTNVSVNPNKNNQNVKRHRERAEIFDMMEHIQDSAIGNGLWTRCLAWCAGEITGTDLYDSLVDYAKKNNINYIRPSEKEYIR